MDILNDKKEVLEICSHYRPDVIIHLAARPGVRNSFTSPEIYNDINCMGTLNMLNAAKLTAKLNHSHFIFASSSSVYGNNRTPFTENQMPDPKSPYATTKISKFVNKIKNGEIIQIYGDGTSKRDYTYIDDIIEGILKAIYTKQNDYDIYNLGSGIEVELNNLIRIISKTLKKTPVIEYINEQPGDVKITLANIERAKILLNYVPKVSIEEGVERFIKNENLSKM
jgi:UDP-glucuronate 4-epimerase